MHEAQMTVNLISEEVTPLRRAMIAASKCYDSKPSIKALRACADSGHMSVFDHVSFTFDVSGVSRALLAQITRYRVGVAFTVRSQRYCDESGASFVVPPSVKKSPMAYAEFNASMDAAVAKYSALVAHGIPKEDARFLLPNACATSFVMTVDATELIHICNQRLCNRAQWEIRALFEKIAHIVTENVRELAPYLVPSCGRLGYCPEVHGCGRFPSFDETLRAENAKGYFEAYAEMEADGKLENGNGIE